MLMPIFIVDGGFENELSRFSDFDVVYQDEKCCADQVARGY